MASCVHKTIELKTKEAAGVYTALTGKKAEAGDTVVWLSPPDPFVDLTAGVEELLDPWRHRSRHMRCSSCMWFAPKEPHAVGRCRRRAPTMSGYPVVLPLDWCGDHKLNEEAANE